MERQTIKEVAVRIQIRTRDLSNIITLPKRINHWSRAQFVIKKDAKFTLPRNTVRLRKTEF